MRGLKFLVIFMGILIIIGTSVLIALIVLKGQKNTKQISKEFSPETSTIILEKNSQILDITSNNNNLILNILENKKNKIIIIDILSGNIIRKININKKE